MHFYDHIIIILNKILYNQKLILQHMLYNLDLYKKKKYCSTQGGFGVN